MWCANLATPTQPGGKNEHKTQDEQNLSSLFQAHEVALHPPKVGLELPPSPFERRLPT